MAKAELFDGTILDFEDGTPDAVIERVSKAETERIRTEQARQPLPEGVQPSSAGQGRSAGTGGATAAEVRAAARAIWDAHHALKALKAEGEALNYGETLVTQEGEPTAGQILAVAYATNDAIATLMATGNATNIAKVL
jgi:hypothetical protein